MFYYEVKKIVTKKSSKIALCVLAVVFCVVVLLCIHAVDWVDENGESHSGLTAIHKLREAQLAWKGDLTEDVIARVIEENDRINQTKEGQSKDIQQGNIAYGWKQGFSEIRELINSSFGEFRNYDYYLVDRLSPKDASKFYNNRTDMLKKWLNGEADSVYSEEEKEFFICQFEKMKQPLKYTFLVGWNEMLEYATTIIMIMTIILGTMVASAFSGEISLRADAILFTSRHGRGKAIRAKIGAVLFTTTVIYFVTMVLYSCILLLVFGVDGADCMIQAGGLWKSFYNITFFQEYLLVLFGGYIGCLFMSSLTALISATTKSTVFASMIPLLLIFAPSFLSFIQSDALGKVLGLMPDQLLSMNQTVRLFNIYKVGGNMVGAVGILMVLYFVLTILLQPATYLFYRKTGWKC